MRSSSEWHQRFVSQAQWTKPARQYIINKFGISPDQKGIELGCGTGAVLEEFFQSGFGNTFGLDINFEHLQFSKINSASAFFQGDAYKIPVKSDSFDFAYCHFLLLWLENPTDVLKEMKRIVKPSGLVILFAEPDYTARIDYPKELELIGQLQQDSLKHQGACVDAGRKIGYWMHQCGLNNVQTGLIGGEWKQVNNMDFLENEWEMIAYDLEQIKNSGNIEELKQLDFSAWKAGYRILYVPTFYSIGIVA